MSDRLLQEYNSLKMKVRAFWQGHLPLALSPLVIWAGYYFWQEIGLLIASAGASAMMLLAAFLRKPTTPNAQRDMVTGLEMRDGYFNRTKEVIDYCKKTGRSTASFIIEIDAHSELIERYGQTTFDRIFETVADRVMICMRADDVIARINENQVAITLHPIKRIDLELSLQIAARLQASIEEPIAVNASSVYITASIGMCILPRSKARTADGLIEAASIALQEARRTGPSAIRAYSSDMKRVEIARQALTEEALSAFERGEICAWFQPQISTDTGHVSGIEALARWIHPQRGLISPAEFLPALEQAGLMDQLNEKMLRDSLETLRSLDVQGIHIPVVGVNFSAEELSNPKLIERIQWQLDRYELTPQRLAVEILETVVAGAPEDILMRNISSLAALGCRIDLDDFGTGHASITSLRSFPIDRLKIDRSFVTKCDSDPEQQRMLTAILTMADRLDMETLAEGLETVGEHALISQLGVAHVQGFGIARPMPVDMLAEWVGKHHEKVALPPAIGGSSA